jgi:hypothetical protein
MRREIQYGSYRFQLKRRLGVATPFRLVLVIEGPDASPADVSNRVIKCLLEFDVSICCSPR